jgi:asparagine synthase (glutamine-hydrolysing)
MCGIVGIYSIKNEPVSPVILKRMSDELKHRGPDDEGIYCNGNIGLAHRRLSILDLSQLGKQPMTTKSERFIIVYNGEVYNFKELRIELQSKGYKFYSNTDTEVVLCSYAEWGARCLNRFNGMFAFAIWDNLKKELFLARDRYGVKPLYYSITNNNFLFASEQKAILKYPKLKKEMDKEALIEYFTFQNIFTDKTFFKNIKVLEPGHLAYVFCSNNNIVINVNKYWDFDFKEPDFKLSLEEYMEETERLFKQAVNRQLVSDVEIGSYLSGGIDSGAITAISASQMNNLKTFTCGFDLHSASGLELGFDEREAAEYMSYVFKTEHYEMVLKSGDMERIFKDLVWHMEEPRVGQSYPNFYIAKLASKFVKVTLSGTGGDELFAGYPWRYYRAVANDNFEAYIDKYYAFWQRLIPNKILKDFFKPIWGEVKHIKTREIFKAVFNKKLDKIQKPEEYINLSLYFEAKTFLSGLLGMEDKLSMANSLETRVPFLDNDLVDFAMKVPISLKLNNLNEVIRMNENEIGPKNEKYFKKTNDGKIILRNVLKKYAPDEIWNGLKKGFSAPDASWFRGESIEYLKTIIFNDNSLIYNFIDKNLVRVLVKEHLEGKENRRLLIWSLLYFENYCKVYL